MACSEQSGTLLGWQAKPAGNVASCFIAAALVSGTAGCFLWMEEEQGAPGEASDSPSHPSVALIERRDYDQHSRQFLPLNRLLYCCRVL